MDGHADGEEDEDSCLQVVRCSKSYVPSLSHWTLQALRSLTCQSSFARRRNPSLRVKRIISPAATVVPLLHRSFSRGLLSSGHANVKTDSVKCFSSFCMCSFIYIEFRIIHYMHTACCACEFVKSSFCALLNSTSLCAHCMLCHVSW